MSSAQPSPIQQGTTPTPQPQTYQPPTMSPGYNQMWPGNQTNGNAMPEGSYLDPMGGRTISEANQSAAQGTTLGDTLQNTLGAPQSEFNSNAQNFFGSGTFNPMGSYNPLGMSSTSTPPPQGQTNLATGQQLMFNPMNALPQMSLPVDNPIQSVGGAGGPPQAQPTLMPAPQPQQPISPARRPTAPARGTTVSNRATGPVRPQPLRTTAKPVRMR